MANESLLALLAQSGDATQAINQNVAQDIANRTGLQQLGANQQAQQIQDWQFQQAQQQAAQQRAQQQAYQAAAVDFIKNPTAEGAANLQLRFPEQQKAIQQSWEVRDKAVQEADRLGLAKVYSAIDNKHPELALQDLQVRQAADKAAGKNEPMVDALLSAMQADPSGAYAKGLAAHVLAMGPGGAEFVKMLPSGKDDSVVVNQGGALVRNSDGKVLYQAPREPEYKILKNADGSEDLHALTQSGGSQRYMGGWTPRQRNGGDNPDVNVDAKLVGASKILGVGQTDDVTRFGPMAVAKAMTAGEQVDPKYNNPAAIMDPKTHKLRTYPTPEAGMNAAAALVARKFKNGQTTVQSLIEGLPVGGQGGTGGFTDTVVARSNGAGSGGVEAQAQAIARGDAAPITGRASVTGMGASIMNRVYELNPDYDAKVYAPRVAALKSFTSGGDSKTVQALNNATQHLAQLGTMVDALRNGDSRTLNRIGNAMSAEFGGTAPTDFQAVKQMVGGELAKVIAGGVSGEGDRAEASKWLSEANSPAQLKSAIERVKGLLGSQFHTLQNKYETGTGKKDFLSLVVPDVKNAWAADGTSSRQLPSAHNPFNGVAQASPVRINSREQAAALPAGTRFVDPSGKVWTKK